MKTIIVSLIAIVICIGCQHEYRGINGIDGKDGTNGVDGKDGADGINGVDGKDGSDGKDGFNAVIEVIDPCGTQSMFDEVLFRLSDGEVYAVYASGSKIHLVRLVTGYTYQTTDGTSCIFNYTLDKEVKW